MLNLPDLDDVTRRLMVEEIESDLDGGRLYRGSYLSDDGWHRYPEALLEAARTGDDAALAIALTAPGVFMTHAPRRTPSGGITQAAVRRDAPQMLAEGEFNRFYLRSIARRAIDERLSIVVIRAKVVEHPRAESEARVGVELDPEQLLRDLRENIGVDTALGVPAGPNSGLSARMGRAI